MGKAIEDLRILQAAEEIADTIWTAVMHWGELNYLQDLKADPFPITNNE